MKLQSFLMLGLWTFAGSAAAQQAPHVCGAGPGPNEIMAGVQPAGPGVAPTPLCYWKSGAAGQQPGQSPAAMYGAIAVGAGDTLFFLNKSLDQGGAEQAALEACRQEEGAQCKLLTSYQHTGNVMAVGRGEDGGWYWNAASPITAKLGIGRYCKEQGANCKSTKVLVPGLGANRIKKYTLTADGSKR